MTIHELEDGVRRLHKVALFDEEKVFHARSSVEEVVIARHTPIVCETSAANDAKS